MLLVLGDREIDATHRAVVIAVDEPAPRRSSDGAPIAAAGPFDADPPARIAQVTAAVVAGERVIASTQVHSDRRVVEVLARILEARTTS